MFGNFDAAAKFMQLCRSSFVVVILVVVTVAEIELQQETVLTGDGRSSGSEVTAEYPYLVGLTIGGIVDKTNRKTAICTGTLVSPVLVLSSAYCTLLLMTTINESPEVTTLFLKKPFKHVERFVRLSSKTLSSDVELSCVVVGIGAPHERGYKVPVRVKYGRTACRIPKSNPGLEYLIGYTWADFLCSETVGPTTTRLPCDRADPLVCSGSRHQYGIFSYGYDGTGASPATEATECGDPAIQGRHLFINRNAGWIAEIIANHGGDSKQIDEDKKTTMTTTMTPTMTTTMTTTITTTMLTKRRRSTRLRPTATSTRVPEDSSTDQLEVNYPYLVYLEGLYDEPVCGGTLVSPWHVLTTAYCTTRMTEIMVTVTTYRKQRVIASLVYIHPDFDTYTLTADISIVVLREPLNVTRYARLPDIVSEPTDGDNDDATSKAMSCAVVAASKRLTPYHYVPVDVGYGPKACRESSDSDIQTAISKTWREFTCGKFNYRFLNDTGDPLICDGFQYGIISHTYRTSELATEAGSVDQVRFVVVDHHREWIHHVITADNQLGSGDGRRNASSGLVVTLVVMTVVFQLLSQFRPYVLL
eukprot:XP_016657668.1 PREDICTED: uncharacterized protein LOC100575281 isoform X2 [Acyrthosiphon pisum]